MKRALIKDLHAVAKERQDLFNQRGIVGAVQNDVVFGVSRILSFVVDQHRFIAS